MSAISVLPSNDVKLPTHKDLPCEDGSIATNFLEAPQHTILSESLFPVFEAIHPDKDFAVGNDCGIYWRNTNPPLSGAVAPDWFYVPNVPPMLDGEVRRSYVLWQEHVPPLLVVEFVSGNGSEEHDVTPGRGKFWIYEREILVANYVIWDGFRSTVELYRLVRNRYVQSKPNSAGRFEIPELGIEFGLKQETLLGSSADYLRAWDSTSGKLLLHAIEREAELEEENRKSKRLARQEKQRAEQEKQRAEQEKQRADRLAEQLRALGVKPVD